MPGSFEGESRDPARKSLASVRRRTAEFLLYVASPAALLITSPMLAQGLGEVGRGELGVAQAVVAFAAACGSFGQAEAYLARSGAVGTSGYFEASRIASISAVAAAIPAAIWLLHLGMPIALSLIAVALIVLQSQSAMWRAAAIRYVRLLRPALANAFGATLRVIIISALTSLSALSLTVAFTVVQGAIVIGAIVFLGSFAILNMRTNRQAGQYVSYTELARAGAPLLLFHAFTTVTLNANLFILRDRVSASQLGVFAGASALAAAALSVSGAFRSRAQSAVFSSKPIRRFRREMAIALSVSTVAGLAAVALAPPIVRIFLGHGYESAVDPLRILAVASIFLVLMDCIHGVLAIVANLFLLVAIAAIGSVALATSSLLLIPRWGLPGAAAGSLIAYATVAIIGYIAIEFAFRRLDSRFPREETD